MARGLHAQVSEVAALLNERRAGWFNPAEWIEPIVREVDAEDDFAYLPKGARALIREPAIMAKAA